MIGCNLANSLITDALLFQFGVDIVQPYLVQLVNRYGNVHYLIGLTDNLGNAAQYLAVVDFNAYTDAETRKYGIDYLHQFHFIQQGVAAHHIGITLIELTITPFLRTVGTPVESGNA